MMQTIEDIKAATGSWEKTARRFYELLEAVAQSHPDTDEHIQNSLHTEATPKKKPGRESPDFHGSIKGDGLKIGLAEFALIIRNAAEIKSNQEAAEYILRKQIQYGMHDRVTPEEEKRITRSLAKRISEAGPKKAGGPGKYSK